MAVECSTNLKLPKKIYLDNIFCTHNLFKNIPNDLNACLTMMGNALVVF